MGRLCRELALLQARRALTIAVGHLATKLNTWADALSRLSAPEPAEVPEELLALPRRAWPELDTLFRIRPLGDSAPEEEDARGQVARA